MEKIKVDIFIEGNLLCINKLHGGGIYALGNNSLNEYFDIDSAVRINGTINIESFDSSDKIVVVTGSVACKGGGCCGEQ